MILYHYQHFFIASAWMAEISRSIRRYYCSNTTVIQCGVIYAYFLHGFTDACRTLGQPHCEEGNLVLFSLIYLTLCLHTIITTDMVVSEDCEVIPSRTEILSELFTELGDGLAISDAGSIKFIIKCMSFDCIILPSPNIKQ